MKLKRSETRMSGNAMISLPKFAHAESVVFGLLPKTPPSSQGPIFFLNHRLPFTAWFEEKPPRFDAESPCNFRCIWRFWFQVEECAFALKTTVLRRDRR